MPDATETATAPNTISLPAVSPLGGSKWARHFAGPREVAVTVGATVTIAGATVHPDGTVTADGEGGEESVFALPAGEGVSLGQFIAGPLNLALAASAARLCGAPLTPRQTDVLARLGRLRDYVALSAPRRFATVVMAPDEPGARPAVPGQAFSLLAGQLRAAPAPQTGIVAILPARESERFCLTNRASLTAWLRAKFIDLLDVEAMRLSDTAARLSAARVVLLADARQSGLLGLCHPGTRILEIAPEGWLGPEAQALSQMFGLDWRPFLAAPPSYPLLNALPFGSRVPCSYEIPIRALAKALNELGA